MSIARNFIKAAKSVDPADYTHPDDVDIMAEDYDRAIQHAVTDQRRRELGYWIFEPYQCQWHKDVIEAVVADMTEDETRPLSHCLHPIDYHRGTVALMVSIEEVIQAGDHILLPRDVIDLTPTPQGWAYVEA